MPASCRAGAGAHWVDLDGHVPDRAAACEVGLGGVEPVPAADQHAGAEGRVQLVPGEGEVVDAPLLDVDAAVRCELSGVDEDPCAATVRDLGEGGDRQHLAGHVGRARHREQGGGLASTVRRRAGGRLVQRVRGPHDARVLPRQQVRVVLDVEDHGAAAGTQPASRFSESVVFRVKTTTWSSARSDEPGDRVAGLLVALGRHPRRVAGAAVHAGVRREQCPDAVGHLRQRRRAGGVVEVDVGAVAALNERNPQVGARNLGQGGNTHVGGQYSSHHDIPRSQGLVAGSVPSRSPRLPGPVWTSAWSSPGAPRRGGGLPTSKPGLDAGTRDLFRRLQDRRAVVNPKSGRVRDPGPRTRVSWGSPRGAGRADSQSG